MCEHVKIFIWRALGMHRSIAINGSPVYFPVLSSPFCSFVLEFFCYAHRLVPNKLVWLLWLCCGVVHSYSAWLSTLQCYYTIYNNYYVIKLGRRTSYFLYMYIGVCYMYMHVHLVFLRQNDLFSWCSDLGTLNGLMWFVRVLQLLYEHKWITLKVILHMCWKHTVYIVWANFLCKKIFTCTTDDLYQKMFTINIIVLFSFSLFQAYYLTSKGKSGKCVKVCIVVTIVVTILLSILLDVILALLCTVAFYLLGLVYIYCCMPLALVLQYNSDTQTLIDLERGTA